jgi:hypothetical protein
VDDKQAKKEEYQKYLKSRLQHKKWIQDKQLKRAEMLEKSNGTFIIYGPNSFKLRHTPFSFNRGQWKKKDNGVHIDVEFGDVVNEVPDYILNDLLYNLDIFT